MSDIFVSSGLPVDRNKIAKSLSWTPQTKSWTGEIGDLSWVVARVDDPALWAPAHDPESGVRVILGGRIAPEEAGWKAAEYQIPEVLTLGFVGSPISKSAIE